MEGRENCNFYKKGKCMKFGDDRLCNPSNRGWLETDYGSESFKKQYGDGRKYISTSDMCEFASIFYNNYVGLTFEAIEQILKGKIVVVESYEGPIFIGYKPEIKKEKHDEFGDNWRFICHHLINLKEDL